MPHGPDPKDSIVEDSLVVWRQKATKALIAATAVVYLPAVALMIAGQGPPIALPVKAVILAVYAVVIGCLALPKTDYRKRAWAFMIAGYVVTLVCNIAVPQGPFARALPIILPMLTIVLFGARAGRVAAVAGIAVLLFAPLLHEAPALVGFITTAPEPSSTPLGMIMTQSAALTALLVAPIILLDRFHQFLMQSLAGLKQEAAARRDAYINLEREMAERKRLALEAAHAGDDERRRLGHEIHDGVCQQLTAALLRSEALARRLGRGEIPAVGELSALSTLLEESIDEAHAVAQGLCPLGPDAGALAAALRTLAKRTWDASGIPCQYEAAGDVTVSESVTAQHLYRIAQEAVSNAVRHAHAGRITMRLQGGGNTLLLEVEDDGDGLPGEFSAKGMGLRTMAYRAGLMEGELTVTPAPGGGTRVTCRAPRGEVQNHGD